MQVILRGVATYLPWQSQEYPTYLPEKLGGGTWLTLASHSASHMDVEDTHRLIPKNLLTDRIRKSPLFQQVFRSLSNS